MPASDAAAAFWQTARGPLSLERPRIAAILNVTPDSFWTGGRHAARDEAARHADRVVAEGADLIDIGGESTRPGAEPVPAEEELARVLPVLEEVVRRHPSLPISVDTTKASVARAAFAAGAAAVNDVSGLRLDPALGPAVAAAGAGLVLMHSRGSTRDMASYDAATYGADPVGDVVIELEAAVARARQAGLRDSQLAIDPGLGFSKRTEHSAAVLGRLGRVAALGFPVLIGPSRKRFVGELGGGLPADARLEGTLAACVVGLLHGARLFRVHDVGPARRALDVAEALRRAG
jgi:dihydropteroate synthase